MKPVFCTDCGTEAELVDGVTIGRVDPDRAGRRFWRCPECPDSWSCHIEALDGPGEPPSGPATKAARVMLQERRVEPLIQQALRSNQNERALAQGRTVNWLFQQLGLPTAGAGLGLLGIEQLRQAYTILGRTDYAAIRQWAANNRRVA